MSTEDNDPYSNEQDLVKLHSELPKKTSTRKVKMPDELKALVDNFTPFQRKYLELRARGLKQAEAAKRAGSAGKDVGALGRIGYQVEQNTKGATQYMTWLMEARSRAALVDENEIVDMLKINIREALALGKIGDANKAVELLGLSIGMFQKDSSLRTKDAQSNTKDANSALNARKIEAFKDGVDGDEVNSSDERQRQIAKLLKDLNRSKTL